MTGLANDLGRGEKKQVGKLSVQSGVGEEVDGAC